MISAIVLASGNSKRMGENKLLMKYKGKSIISYSLEELIKSNVDEIVVITKYDEIKELVNSIKLKSKNYDINIRFKVVNNLFFYKGQSESIKLGILNCKENNNYMFLVGDQPLIKKKVINTLIDKFKENNDFIVIPRNKKKNGNPVIFPNSYKKELLKLEGDIGGRVIIKKSTNKTYVDIEEKYLFDIDDINDYHKLINKF